MSWQRCVCPFAILFTFASVVITTANAAPKTESAAADSVRALLDAGLKGDFSVAEKYWRSHRLAAQRDARLDYAWGLILRKHAKNREAERQFLSAAGRRNPTYLPARQAVIWLKLASNETSSALAQTDLLVRVVASGKGLEKSDRFAAARWIGMVLAAFEKQALSRRDTARLKSIRSKVTRQFRGELAKAIIAGGANLAAKINELETADLKRKLLAKKQKKQQVAKKEKSLSAKQTKTAKKTEAIKRSAEQWKEWLEAKEKAAKVLLGRQLKEFQILERRRQSLLRSMALLSQEHTTRKSRFQQAIQAAGRNRQRRDLLVNSANQVLGRLENEYAGYYQQSVVTFAQMFKIRQNAQRVIQQFKRDAKQYESITGKLAQRGNVLSKYQETLDRAQRKLKNQKLRRSLSSNSKDKATYRMTRLVEFDLEAERTRLLKSLAK